jgi:hypothetical protein
MIVLVALLGSAAIPESGSSVFAQTASQQTPPAQPGQSGQQPDMAEMMKHHQQMMAEMKAADAKLGGLVAAMNSASGDAKISALAQVVTELVRQHKTMHEHMGMMGQHMMMGRGGRGMMRGR